jgi:hypothetical protein
MASSFVISVVFFLMKKTGHPLPFAQTVLFSVLFTTGCWLLAVFFGPKTDRPTLFRFYQLVHPAGPGWSVVRAEIIASSPPASGEATHLPEPHGDHMGMATLGWISGCIVIWSSLFAIGNLLYGRMVAAGVLTLAFIVSGIVLLYVINRLWAPARPEPTSTPQVQHV